MSAEYDKDSGRYEKLSEKNDEERNPVVRGGLGEDGEGDFDEDSDPRMIMKSLEGKKGKEGGRFAGKCNYCGIEGHMTA